MTAWLAMSVLLAGAPAQTPEAALARAEATWRATRPQAYEFTIEVRCFCVDLVTPAPAFGVIVESPAPLRPLSARSRRAYSSYDTIEKLFAMLRTKLSFGRHRFSVQYDAATGIPLSADVDPSPTRAEDELSFRVTNFRPVEMVRVR